MQRFIIRQIYLPGSGRAKSGISSVISGKHPVCYAKIYNLTDIFARVGMGL